MPRISGDFVGPGGGGGGGSGGGRQRGIIGLPFCEWSSTERESEPKAEGGQYNSSLLNEAMFQNAADPVLFLFC